MPRVGLGIGGKKPFNILFELLTNLIDSFSSPEHFILFFVQSVCYKLKPVHIFLSFSKKRVTCEKDKLWHRAFTFK